MKRGNAVLVVGSGGREHAIVHKLSQSEFVEKIYVAPGNGGTFSANCHNSKIQNLNISSDDTKSIVSVTKALSLSLVVVGPENPLVNGLSDEMALQGIPCFGPTAAAAKIESSKAWSKDFMKRNGIPTARFESFTVYEELVKYLNSIDHRIVIKASGLAAGKGVLLPETREEALQAAQDIMINKIFGEAGNE